MWLYTTAHSITGQKEFNGQFRYHSVPQQPILENLSLNMLSKASMLSKKTETKDMIAAPGRCRGSITVTTTGERRMKTLLSRWNAYGRIDTGATRLGVTTLISPEAVGIEGKILMGVGRMPDLQTYW